MDISKLTIQGFKSFYEKSVFTFGKNITAIVGPNGSGKSNITEAIRFVLGEQSAKSMRGKDVTDMLFRGNNVRASKAKVEVEFVKNKNIQTNTENIFVKEMLEKDIVIVTRTIYADGKSEYQMNGVEVRVKDLHEFLLYIHLGNKSSWHISQGEADKVLQANPQERKTIIEDALGLKVYHARINDSQKKLEKTKENIREATLKRREIMPELNALSKQVERIKRSQEFRNELEQKANLYLNIKKQSLDKVTSEQTEKETVSFLSQKLEEIEIKLKEKEKSMYREGSHDTSFLERELDKEQTIFNHVSSEQENLLSKLRNNSNNIDYLKLEESRNQEELSKIEAELKQVESVGNDIVFVEKNVLEVRDKIEDNTKRTLKSDTIEEAKRLAEDTDFTYKKMLATGSIVNKDNVKQVSYLQGIRNRVQDKLQQVKNDEEKYQQEVDTLKSEIEKGELKVKISGERVEAIKKQIVEFKYLVSETERAMQALSFERSKTEIRIAQAVESERKIRELELDFQNELQEFKMILGNFSFTVIDTAQVGDLENQNLKRNIERLKIRLEESQVTNPEEVINNFNQMSERDNFLVQEISDLEKSIVNLEKLIFDLKNSLKQEFDLGLEHINTIFDSYVKRLFGGGSAKVFVVEIEPRKKNDSSIQDDNETEQSEEEEVKIGVEVEVEIPKKKVKGLHSLSGGERALVSIALNFSIVNQNPAPFMILDETDAALDEANSKRYGEILEMLKKHTRLIVVTHNRETMHFADQVYGVTLSKEGHSKVLSVSFEDAIEYAK